MDISPTPFKTLVDRLLPKLQSLGLGDITEEQADSILYRYIYPACIKFRACKQDLSNKDSVLQTFNVELTDEEIEILSHFMLIEWLSANYINVPLLLKQSLAPKDWQVFSKRNHLDGLINLREIYTKETRQMISAYSVADSNLFDVLKAMSEDSSEDTDIENTEI